MSNMENLSFDEGLKSYKINGDPNRILRFNPGDVNILTRYKEVVNNLNNIKLTKYDNNYYYIWYVIKVSG